MAESAPEVVSLIAWQTVGQVALRIQENPGRDWSLEELARQSGYSPHHMAHLFRAVIGESPNQYVKRLRLEWAAFVLRDSPEISVADIGRRIRYDAPEAFSRAFHRQFGAPPSRFREEGTLLPPSPQPVPRPVTGDDWPVGLDPNPVIESIGPLWAWSCKVRSFASVGVMLALRKLTRARPVDGPWVLGGVSQPWGWVSGRGPHEFRVIRLVSEADARPPPPFLPWKLGRGWYARFTFDGPGWRIKNACRWLMEQWVPRSGLRHSYAPLFSLADVGYGARGGRVRLHAPISIAAAIEDDGPIAAALGTSSVGDEEAPTAAGDL